MLPRSASRRRTGSSAAPARRVCCALTCACWPGPWSPSTGPSRSRSGTASRARRRSSSSGSCAASGCPARTRRSGSGATAPCSPTGFARRFTLVNRSDEAISVELRLDLDTDLAPIETIKCGEPVPTAPPGVTVQIPPRTPCRPPPGDRARHRADGLRRVRRRVRSGRSRHVRRHVRLRRVRPCRVRRSAGRIRRLPPCSALAADRARRRGGIPQLVAVRARQRCRRRPANDAARPPAHRAGRRPAPRRAARPRARRPRRPAAHRARPPRRRLRRARARPGTSPSSAATPSGRPRSCCRYDVALAGGTLRTLARAQGRATDPETGEEPGKILHERRRAATPVRQTRLPAALLRHHRRDPAVDLPAARRVALGPARRGGRAPCCRTWRPRSAGSATPHGDGFVEYHDPAGRGLANQGWKDSADAVRFADGRQAEPARSRWSRCRATPTRRRSRAPSCWRRSAAPARRRWRDLRGRPRRAVPRAVLGRRRRRRRSRRSRSTAPATGVDALDQQHRPPARHRPARRRRGARWSPARLSPGPGGRLRRCARCRPGPAGYSPLSYHCGSVWPHDTAIVARGLSRAGSPRARRPSWPRQLLAAGRRVRRPAARAVRGLRRRRGRRAGGLPRRLPSAGVVGGRRGRAAAGGAGPDRRRPSGRRHAPAANTEPGRRRRGAGPARRRRAPGRQPRPRRPRDPRRRRPPGFRVLTPGGG